MMQDAGGTQQDALERSRAAIQAARARGPLATAATFIRLSGPGWLASALTLGGGSLGSSLYLGILGGVSLLWLQPFAMAMGVIMLGAISYVTLSTGMRPLEAINRHLHPAIGWAWVAATLLANMVWTLPQYSLCYAVAEQNLLPGLFHDGGALAAYPEAGPWVVSLAILVLCTFVTWSYGSGNRGIAIYEMILKIVVAVIVLSFVGVVVRMAWTGDGIDWGKVGAGLIPRWSQLMKPSPSWDGLLGGVTNQTARDYWTALIVSQQRDVMLSAGAAAVGINMTFLMPYMLLARGWDRDFRGLTLFDLCTGMFIPFVVATGCIVIASAQQFHTKVPRGFEITASDVIPPERLADAFEQQIETRNTKLGGATAPPISKAEKVVIAALVQRDTQDLAQSLQALFGQDGDATGAWFANVVFGMGVAGMTLSSISLMMLISGLAVCEIAGVPPRGWLFRIGCMISATGVLWPLVWTADSKAYLTIPAGVVGAMLLPIAYITFFLMMNNPQIMGSEMPRGSRRLTWNVLMGIAAVAATAAGVSAIIKKLTEAIQFFSGA